MRVSGPSQRTVLGSMSGTAPSLMELKPVAAREGSETDGELMVVLIVLERSIVAVGGCDGGGARNDPYGGGRSRAALVPNIGSSRMPEVSQIQKVKSSQNTTARFEAMTTTPRPRLLRLRNDATTSFFGTGAKCEEAAGPGATAGSRSMMSVGCDGVSRDPASIGPAFGCVGRARITVRSNASPHRRVFLPLADGCWGLFFFSFSTPPVRYLDGGEAVDVVRSGRQDAVALI